MRALHRSIDDRHLEQLKARRQLLLLGMVVAVAVASLLQVSVLRTGAPMDFMARYAASGLVDQGRTPYDRDELLAAEQQLWPGVSVVPFYDPPPTAAAFRLFCKPQLAYLRVAVVLVHGYRHDRQATIVGAAAAAVALVLLARWSSPSAGWSDLLTALRDQPAGPGWSVRLALFAGGVTGIAFALRAAAACRDSLLGWLLLAASCNGLAAAVVRWKSQWLSVLVLPVLALLVLGDPAAWSTGPGHPGAGGSDLLTGHHRQRHLLHGMGWAVIPLSMSAVLLAGLTLARLVPPAWAAAAWVVAAALLLPPFEPWFARVKGLALTLPVLWLLARLGTGWSRLGVADVRSRPAQAAGRRTNRQGQPIG